ncbi:MAG: hypothetical protein M3N54_08915 [Acidobacteriota bacterium]|nr:hypothetical protein [Acidobacteriota bacterium]
MQIPFKFRGRIPATDLLHQMTASPAAERGPAPVWVHSPGGFIPQYAPTVFGTGVRFDPANDCKGSFTSFKYQVHNNCYNYALDIATNTVAQPGRLNGLLMTGDVNGEQVVEAAVKDGLVVAGDAGTTIDDLREKSYDLGDGHFVAVLIADADDSVGFPGDYHWVRCDDLELSAWSQKDGPDQVTNFDFAGAAISDPFSANWSVNSGPFGTTQLGARDFYVTYHFQAWMFVPSQGVNII